VAVAAAPSQSSATSSPFQVREIVTTTVIMSGRNIECYGGQMTITAKDWIAVALSSLFAYVVFGNISSKAGYPRWHGLLMAIPVVNLITLITFAYSNWPLERRLLEAELRDPEC
jgi:hypothetical protein